MKSTPLLQSQFNGVNDDDDGNNCVVIGDDDDDIANTLRVQRYVPLTTTVPASTAPLPR
jgi:hypothetical protein